MAVALENRLRRMQVFNLPHEIVCGTRCACSEVSLYVVAENSRTGDRAPKHISKRIPSALTLLSLERRADLPNAVLDAPEVAAAIGAKTLRVLEHTPEPSPAPAKPPAPAPSQVPVPTPAVAAVGKDA